MSGPDQGDEDKGFLARWSQRKQEAKQPEPPDAPAAEAEIPPEPVAETDAAEEFDLSSLPKLEDMTRNDRYYRVSPQRRSRTSAQCGAAKILGAGSRDPQLRQSRARICL